MDEIKQILDLFLHLGKHLDTLITALGPWFYGLMFLIIFCETGLVVTPLLPGDSLLFALGTFAARGTLNLPFMMLSLPVAAIVGDSVNYWIGSWLGPKIFRGEKVRFLNKKHLERTHQFFERYGGKTIVLARFIPIIRTFAPFVAGMGRMTYSRFMLFNISGGILWIELFLLAGYFFGNIEVVKKNFTLVILGIIVVSILPAVFEFWRERRRRDALPDGAD